MKAYKAKQKELGMTELDILESIWTAKLVNAMHEIGMLSSLDEIKAEMRKRLSGKQLEYYNWWDAHRRTGTMFLGRA